MAGLPGRHRGTDANADPLQKRAMRGEYAGELADVVH